MNAQTAYVTDAATPISTRYEDRDGRLFVGPSVLTRAGVDDYQGREITNWQELGLDPDRIYRLFRSPEALKAAIPKMNMQPLTSEHVALSADDHDEGKTIGAIGSGVAWDEQDQVVRGPLSIWRDPYIARVKSGDQREISMGYRFGLNMTPGAWNGQPYDGVMTYITPNHFALVPAGRVNLNSDGPLAAVADSATGDTGVAESTDDDKEKKPKTTGDEGGEDKSKPTGDEGGGEGDGDALGPIVDCLRKFVPDANDDQLRGAISQLIAALNTQTGENQGGAGDEGGGDDKKPTGDEGKEGCAMDSAAIIAQVRGELTKQFNELRKAEDEVRPVVGKLAIVGDSAGSVYRAALKAKGVPDTDKMGDDEAGRTFRALRGSFDAGKRAQVTGDSANRATDTSVLTRLKLPSLKKIDGIV